VDFSIQQQYVKKKQQNTIPESYSVFPRKRNSVWSCSLWHARPWTSDATGSFSLCNLWTNEQVTQNWQQKVRCWTYWYTIRELFSKL